MDKIRPELFGLNHAQVRVALAELGVVGPISDVVAAGNLGYLIVSGESTGEGKLPLAVAIHWTSFSDGGVEYIHLPYRPYTGKVVIFKIVQIVKDRLLLQVPNSELKFLACLAEQPGNPGQADHVPLLKYGPILTEYLLQSKV